MFFNVLQCENMPDQLWCYVELDNCTIMSYYLHHGSSLSFSHTSTTDCAALSSSPLTHAAILKSKLTWEHILKASGGWTSRLLDGWIPAILTHTLSLLTELQQPPWLSAFPEPLTQIPSWPWLINYAMDRPLESFPLYLRNYGPCCKP